MPSTPSVETPAAQTQNRQSKTAIVVSEQKLQLQNVKRSYSVSSSVSSSASLEAAGSAASQSVGERSVAIALPQPLLTSPSSSSSSSTSTSTNVAATIAAVHHQRQSYSLVQKESSLRYQVKPNQHLANISLSLTMTTSETVPSLTGSSVASLGTSEATSRQCTNAKTKVTPLTSQKIHRTIPSDKINLRLILVSGKTKEFIFNPSDSAGDIAQTVFDNWPADWKREAVSKAEILRLIYQGRFLHCNVTLGALGLPLGKTTVMHLVPRDNLPEPNSQDQRQKSKGGSASCCSTTCCIL
ncbi:A-agglutinin anchorage subunit [Drosophila madeirensis]|uniref:A-agglutinin anchorage subunit n=1 Tax=Drosophila madeirensis TaxID=30013 RepID=A0AAU9FWE5_DROMD